MTRAVLIVDDSLTVRMDLAEAFEAAGFRPLPCASLAEARKVLAHERVDVAVLDALLSDGDGFDLLAAVRATRSSETAPVLVLSTEAAVKSQVQGMQTRCADDYVAKPYDVGYVVARAGELLRARPPARGGGDDGAPVLVIDDGASVRDVLGRAAGDPPENSGRRGAKRVLVRRKHTEDERRRVREEILRRKLDAADERAWRKLAEQRAALVDELQRRNDELETFSYSVSHDLRAPLRAIDGFSRAALEDCGPMLGEQGRAHLHRVRAAAQRMGRLIDDLLHLSRVGRAELSRRSVDLSAIGEAVVGELRRGDPSRRVEVAIRPNLAVRADAGLARLLLDNLLGNAWKFTSKMDQARIELGATERPGEAAFFVRDNGAGFDPRNAQRLFRAFQRLHTEHDFPGTGIGLATVHRIVDRHGGRVWAEGAPGAGATFYFTLPSERTATATARDLEAANAATR